MLIFEEQFEVLVSEIKDEKSNHIADELKSLIVKDFVRPCRELESGKASGFMYDSDQLSHYSFTLTKKGLDYLEWMQNQSQG